MKPVALPLTPEWLHWGYPWALLLFLLLPLLWRLWLRRERRPVIRFSSLREVTAAAGGAARRARLILPILRSVALAALIIAAARPQQPDETNRVFAEGVAIQLVVDTSGSMSDLDLSPPNAQRDRLEVVKEVVRRFVLGDEELAGRRNDLIGLIRFSKFADAICPLTLDHKNLLEALAKTSIVTTPEEDGTAIGDALALAVERLKDLQRTSGSGEQIRIKSRVIILLTDGENNFGAVEPVTAGELAATYGLKVYTILSGTGQNTGYFIVNGRRMDQRREVDDRDLRRIAEVTGGKHFTAKDAASLQRIYEEIDRLERTKTEERSYLVWGELSLPWLLLAFACISAQSVLEATRMRKIP